MAKRKRITKYICTAHNFWFDNGNDKKIIVEANTMKKAKAKARSYFDNTYGTMSYTYISVKEEVNNDL